LITDQQICLAIRDGITFETLTGRALFGWHWTTLLAII